MIYLSREPIDHLPDSFSKCIARRNLIKVGNGCSCGIQERHEHCPGCGRLVSIGDWGAPPIAEYTLSKRGLRRVK
jgi:hypothetical protein